MKEFFGLKKNYIKSIFFFILSIVIILQTDTVYIDHYHIARTLLKLIFLFLSFILLCCFLPKIKEDRRIRKNIYIFSFLAFIFLILNSYINYFKINNFLTFLFVPIVYIIFFYFNKQTNLGFDFWKIIENVIIVISFISIVFWILSNMGMHYNSIITVGWGAMPGHLVQLPGYFGIHFISQQSSLSGVNLIRNSGFFSESPIFSYVLSTGLLIHLFILDGKKNNLKLYILLVTIISTLSITGIIISLLAVSYYYFFIYNNDSLSLFANRKSIVVASIVMVLLFIVLYEKVVLSDGSSMLSSTSIRIDDFKACFKTFVQHPFIGCGLDNTDSIIKNMNPIRYGFNTGLSTGLMSVLAYGGIYLFLMYIIPIVISIKCSKKTFGFGIFIFLLGLFTIVSSLYLYILPLTYLYAEYLKRGK